MLTPDRNDDKYTLVYKLTFNLWTKAGGVASGIPAPDMGRDTEQNLLKKAVSASALL